MRTIYPIFRYPDARAAIDWLCTAFGFTVHAVHEAPDGSVAHAELTLDTGMIMLGERSGPRPRPADDDWSVYVALDDVDAHCARARAAGAEIVREPFDTDYGSRDYAARDLAGHVWSFGSYRP
ncbi:MULTISPECIES: VOC family protein [Micromonospora]|uniref:Glyoxalase n=1 Tax=Micromonospora sicca TaxID=2202420 RepID=A0A317DIH3_9ACTN|nr:MULTISPECIES: VOC family protein [unclassified Micromonospora]MBM0228405.1 VOC family protein [Micromonospora sp. ATA51]MDZ5442856.1 VOC family protein [Micromonospora sp. 4G57]MDZ5492268.1 VOC family protein [Micromonospora sp. 4G53]PWR14264.1 glyoxalase [Micromonospora sp. 4G51]